MFFIEFVLVIHQNQAGVLPGIEFLVDFPNEVRHLKHQRLIVAISAGEYHNQNNQRQQQRTAAGDDGNDQILVSPPLSFPLLVALPGLGILLPGRSPLAGGALSSGLTGGPGCTALPCGSLGARLTRGTLCGGSAGVGGIVAAGALSGSGLFRPGSGCSLCPLRRRSGGLPLDRGRRLHSRLFHTVSKENIGILPEFLQVIEHGRGRGIALIRVNGHGPHNNLLQTAGNIGVQRTGHGRAAIDVLQSHRHRRLPVIRGTTANHLIHHNAQGINIRPVIHPATLGLLRGDIVDRAQCLPGQGILGRHDPGDTEVRHLGRAIFQNHHIVGLNVPVDDTLIVSVFQCSSDLHGKVERLLPIEVSAPALHILLQGDALHQLHDNIVRIALGGDIINTDDIGVIQHGDGLALRMETAAELPILRIIVLKNFDGHQPVQPVASCLIYHGHSAGADYFHNLIPVIQQPTYVFIHNENSFLI